LGGPGKGLKRKASKLILNGGITVVKANGFMPRGPIGGEGEGEERAGPEREKRGLGLAARKGDVHQFRKWGKRQRVKGKVSFKSRQGTQEGR